LQKTNQTRAQADYVSHKEFIWWLRKGAIEGSELAKGHIVLCLDHLNDLVPPKQRWDSQSFPERSVFWILEQFDVFSFCREGASPAEPKPRMSVRFSYVN